MIKTKSLSSLIIMGGIALNGLPSRPRTLSRALISLIRTEKSVAEIKRLTGSVLELYEDHILSLYNATRVKLHRVRVDI